MDFMWSKDLPKRGKLVPTASVSVLGVEVGVIILAVGVTGRVSLSIKFSILYDFSLKLRISLVPEDVWSLSRLLSVV